MDQDYEEMDNGNYRGSRESTGSNGCVWLIILLLIGLMGIAYGSVDGSQNSQNRGLGPAYDCQTDFMGNVRCP